MKKIALIGPSYPKKINQVHRLTKNGKIASWPWTYQHYDEKLDLLKKQLEKNGCFKIYVHNSKRRGGTGFVNTIFYVDDFDYHSYKTECPRPDLIENEFTERFPESRGWYYGCDLNSDSISEKWTAFRDYDTGENLPPINRTGINSSNHYWFYVIDEF